MPRELKYGPSILYEEHEAVNFRENLTNTEAVSVDVQMDKNATRLEILETRIHELDALVRNRSKKRSLKRK